MRIVATRLGDVLDDFSYHLADLRHVVAAYCTVEMDPPKIHIWTLLDARDDVTEEALADVEHKLTQSFRQVVFDFTSIHLRDRSPAEFIPEGATPIVIRHPEVLKAFQAALVARAHARA
jgi:hypothetical protein